ncbi:MAG: ribosomal protein S18-alanine N-acetyltransferase [Methanobacteriota archaeon]
MKSFEDFEEIRTKKINTLIVQSDKTISTSSPNTYSRMENHEYIRKAVPGDHKQIYLLEKKCFPGALAYSKQQLKYLLTKAHRTFLVETHNETIRGFIIILYRKGTSIAGLETVNVNPQYQKQGIGKRLLKTAEDEMKKNGIKMVRLEVSPGNRAAIMLYKKEGFQMVSLLKNYYVYPHQGSRDALRMTKELD